MHEGLREGAAVDRFGPGEVEADAPVRRTDGEVVVTVAVQHIRVQGQHPGEVQAQGVSGVVRAEVQVGHDRLVRLHDGGHPAAQLGQNLRLACPDVSDQRPHVGLPEFRELLVDSGALRERRERPVRLPRADQRRAQAVQQAAEHQLGLPIARVALHEHVHQPPGLLLKRRSVGGEPTDHQRLRLGGQLSHLPLKVGGTGCLGRSRSRSRTATG